MRVLEPVERYFDAWNSRDSDAIAACFDSGGGYGRRCPKCGTMIDLDRPDKSCPLRRTIPRRTNLRLAHLRAREPAGGG
jgi:hypothetical protein